MTDVQERTEDATDKHLKEVRSKGQLQKSRDLSAWIAVAAAGVMLPATFTNAQQSAESQVFAIQYVIENPSVGAAMSALGSGLGSMGGTLLPLLLVVALAIVVSTAAQGGIHLKRLSPRFDQFNLVKGIGHLFGAKTAWEAVKTLAKSTIVGAGFFMVMQTLIPVLLQTGGLSVQALLGSAGGGVSSLVRLAIGGGLLFSGFDVFVIIRRNRKASRMTKRQVSDEHKNSEGDPMVRAHRRSRQLAMSRNRMLASVAEASVVIVNPTHVAVALKYEAGKSAPRVVSKGADLVAERIREEARANSIPMVEDIQLARTLHKTCEIGQEIPVEFFTQVAKILAFVMALKKRGASLKEIHTLPVPRHKPNR
ncbi:MAG: flagellar biosynthesis protein FlhB [Microbacteriaceae bacterium]|jgi:flagellar biosynthetic protein FlhB|nr:flagellar biosynthesis protein FlhB [Microbacteriaceae bacterium]